MKGPIVSCTYLPVLDSCTVNTPFSTKYLAAVLPIRDVYPGSEFFHPGSRIQGQKDFRIPDTVRISTK